ncbi:putative membrane protein-like protein [Hapsidospora chrysogenum ATCC 11550]|uniref:Glycerophosphocholine acyltransferase 1 n=1 Tax=Hapsidospora chrysogenum (strain ATCC 11550 / CBS 779.69 / DSM 880 / IAM 14645 / JCM 23072 / IMI 49137) TaxID=857340 RepID=A0A086T1M3_HAPC1|nr:putative membrane protein-like protein [Hapsidospora chrysogenum ATCC 11550]
MAHDIKPSSPESDTFPAAGDPSPPLEQDTTSLLSSSPPDESLLDTPAFSATTSKSPGLSRNPSFSGSSSYQDDWDSLPPLDRLTVLDLLDNFALPQQLEKLQKGISAQTSKVRRSKDVFKSKTQGARERMVEEWRRRLPSAEEQLDRYRKRMQERVDKLGKQWNNTKAVSLREKVSFICGVMNIFISGYLIGGYPEYFHLWYTAQLVYFMPIRFFIYRRRGYHYFLADLCYFTNFLLALSLWVFPASKRLFTAAYCLAFGNNAVAIIMWRNSLVFHSFDKVTSLFIHIMPCATLHCVVHLFGEEKQRQRFPAIWTIRNSGPDSPTAYANVLSMIAWSTLPYAVWQLSYYFFIIVRRREKIAAGRPTSFTWLRRSYSKTWIGKIVLALPDALQEPAFMMIQYLYACLTIVPCPLWFLSRWASSGFLLAVFSWSIYNGSTYYIDVFGKRFQKELEAMKAEVSKWQSMADLEQPQPLMPPHADEATGAVGAQEQAMAVPTSAASLNNDRLAAQAKRQGPVPRADTDVAHLDETKGASTGIDGDTKHDLQERRSVQVTM